jgi:hypothetical protein
MPAALALAQASFILSSTAVDGLEPLPFQRF